MQACVAVVPWRPGRGGRVFGLRRPEPRLVLRGGMSAHHVVAVYTVRGILHGVVHFSPKY